MCYQHLFQVPGRFPTLLGCTHPRQITMQVLPSLEQLWRVHQWVVGPFVHRDTRRQVPNFQGRKTVQARLESPGIARVAHEAQDVPSRVQGHYVGEEARWTPVIVQDDLGASSRRILACSPVMLWLSRILRAAGRR